jgi:hypothetical protein
MPLVGPAALLEAAACPRQVHPDIRFTGGPRARWGRGADAPRPSQAMNSSPDFREGDVVWMVPSKPPIDKVSDRIRTSS